MKAASRPYWTPIAVATLIFWNCTGDDGADRDGSSMPRGFVVVNDEIPSLVFDIRYFSTDNFLGTRVRGYEGAKCLLTRPAAEALKNAQREIVAKGYSFKIFDCYRPQRAVDHFVDWVNDPGDRNMKPLYYPNEHKSRLIEKGYIADRSGHSRGSTLDLTIIASGSSEELDMGTPFDFFDTLSNTADPRITERQKRNRLFLKTVMEKHGFVNYEKEWWHYTLKNEPFPYTYFNFPIK